LERGLGATPQDEWHEKIKYLITEPEWIMDGNLTLRVIYTK
jgi:hypothetical protein